MDELLKYTFETGFAVMIAVYLLVRMEKKIEVLSNSIDKLNEVIKRNADK